MRFKHFPFFTNEQKEKALAYLKEAFEEEKKNIEEEEIESGRINKVYKSSKKKLKIDPMFELLQIEYDKRMEQERFINKDELKKFSEESPLEPTGDTLMWWKEHETQYPILSILAKKYLSIPATSVPSERIFSLSSNIMTKKRTQLGSKTLAALVFLHANSDWISWWSPEWDK